MYDKDINHDCNGKHHQYLTGRKQSLVKFSNRIQLDEWTCSFFLFVVSLTIVIVKLLFIYGADIPTTFRNDLSSLPDFGKHFYNIYVAANVSTTGITDNDHQYANNTAFHLKPIDQYRKILMQTTIRMSDEYGWFVKAILSGLGILGTTWFIVYKDSNIPGINPPSPFSPSKKKSADTSLIQMNYLIGIINGILLFIYMSLQ